ncbi:uncharacterized protein LOC108671099, partial [Hyalella azteca]|uniref:Uncharacterized protein LOC108671099 n=1 Tax=Hyalella azteca TaxID=294128 RepID=A0A8B7NK87_HYAAZ
SDSEFGPGGGTHEVFTSIPSQPIFDDHKPDERDRNEALDDYNRITESLSEYTEPSLSSTQTPVSTYDERRRLNREEYVAKVMQRNRGSVSELRQELPRPPISSGSTSVSSGSTPVARRNQYGDLVYDE